MSRYILLTSITLLSLLAACTTPPRMTTAQPAAQPVQPLVAKPIAVPVTPAATPAPTPAATAQAPQAQIPDFVIALLDFDSDNVSPAETQALSQALAVELFRPKDYGMLPRVETRRYLIANDLYPWMPYQAEVPLARVVAALKVNCLVTGRIDKLGSGNELTIQVSGRDGMPIVKKTEQVSAGPDELAAAIERLVPSIRQAILKSRPKSAPTPIASDKKMKTRVRRAPVQEKIVQPKEAQPAALIAAAATAPIEETPPQATKVVAQPQTAKVEPKLIEAAVKPIATATPTPKPTASPTPQNTVKPTTAASPSPTPTSTPKALVLRATPMTSTQPAATVAPTPKPSPKASATPANDKLSRARALQQEANRLPVKNDKRLDLLKQASDLAPEDLQVLRGLANEYYLRDDFPKCVEVYTRALKIEPNNSMLLTFRGSAHYCQDELVQASDDFGRASQLDPGNHFARYNLALAAHMRKLPEASRLWREYLDKSNGVADQEDQRKEAQRYLATLGKGAN